MSPVCGLQTLLKKLKVKKLLMNVQRISSYIMDPIVGNFCPFFYSNTYCLRIADFFEDEI